ncbi:hypothetical protein GE061_003443 [Apolygus lucorum]|uniref:N-acetylgalactosaminide beta-1,3-galactosyltransferase n=1 Tax=Apolygus lucorum TaxID=248454 RepID=A0A8S9X1J9_APOLU|nr:hypothetical protein GE061_003443 [Apolygus lucorum]
MVLSDLRENSQRALNVNNTWGKRCDKLLFITSRRSFDLDVVLIPESLPETRDTLWDRVTFGFSYVYSHYGNFDWFLKADDDTYVVMENLKLFLNRYNAQDGLYFGCMFLRNRDGAGMAPLSYMSGGAGYILSKEALRLLVKDALPRPHSITWAEDINMALCLKNVNVTSVDTRDSFRRPRFNPLLPTSMGLTLPKVHHDFWYYSHQYSERIEDGPNCCAESAITFHYAVEPLMDIVEFFIYHLSPYQR